MPIKDTKYNPAIGSANGRYEIDKLDTTSASSGQVPTYNGTTVVWADTTDPGSISLTDGHILVGNVSNTATDVALSGDATIVASGALTIASSAVIASKIATAAVTTAKISDGNVTIAKLEAGIQPSHIVKFGGKITWSGSGATLATTVAGVLATDIVEATIQGAPTQAAYLVSAAPTTNTVTIVLSAANTSNDAVIAYTVFRVAT